MTSARRRVLVASAGGFLGYYLLLSVIPYIAARHDGRFAAGLLTFALMVTTVAVQTTIPWLLQRFSARALFAAGLSLIGAPALLYSVSQGVASLTAVTMVRGAGFGLITVMGAGLTAAYSDPRSRARSIGAYGVATSGGAAFAPAVGLAIGRSSLFAIAAVGAIPPLLGALALVPKLPHATIQSQPRSGATPRRAALAAPVIVFIVTSASIGAAFTFIPLLETGSTTLLLALFGAGFTVGRLVGGRLLDRQHATTGPVLGLLIGVGIGLALLGVSSSAAAAVGASLSGVGLGCLATAMLVTMLDRMGADQVMRASVVWNVTFDVGLAFGAVALGAVASLIGPAFVFVTAAGLVAFVAGPVAVLDWRQFGPGTTATA